MLSISLIRSLSYLEIGLCVTALAILLARKQWSDYPSLGSWLAVRASSGIVLFALRGAAGHLITPHAAYSVYCYVYWSSFAVESVIALIIVYSVFKLAMAPLKGLQSLGMLVFKWAAGISFAVALGSAFAPDSTGAKLFTTAMSQLERTQSILTLCLLLFVCFAIRPMGLSYGSRIFGVSLGLGIMSTTDLVQSAWFAFHPEMGQNAYNLIAGLSICVVVSVWATYLALPEPKRRMIVLPTTSPFLRWNQISQALGDAPGFVAVGGVPPDLFAPAELEVMRRASLKMVTPFPPASEARIVGSSRAI